MQLSWDGIGQRLFKAGLDRGVLYPYEYEAYQTGVAWNGLTAVDDDSSGNEQTELYTADRKRSILFTPAEIEGLVKCYTYPQEFDDCIGNDEVAPGLFSKGQSKKPFGLSYRTGIGNDTQGIDYGYEIHLIYNAVVTKATENASSINSDTKVSELSFSFSSIAEDFSYGDPVSHFTIPSFRIASETLQAIENILYGTSESEPRLLLPDELYEMITGGA